MHVHLCVYLRVHLRVLYKQVTRAHERTRREHSPDAAIAFASTGPRCAAELSSSLLAPVRRWLATKGIDVGGLQRKSDRRGNTVEGGDAAAL